MFERALAFGVNICRALALVLNILRVCRHFRSSACVRVYFWHRRRGQHAMINFAVRIIKAKSQSPGARACLFGGGCSEAQHRAYE